jgi:hypothetical protein
MRTIPRVILAASVLLLAAGAAACTAESPTASATAPVGPRLEGGLGFGSGNVVASGGVTFGSGNAVTGGNDNVAADSGSTATYSGGLGFGSGN